MSFDAKKLASIRNNPKELDALIEDDDKDFNIYLETVLKKSEVQEIAANCYDIGIITVGLSIYPLLFSFKAINPKEKVILIFTKESYNFAEVFRTFRKKLGLKCELEEIVLEADSDPGEVYMTMEGLLKGLRQKNIAIDITGGKKPTIAASFFGSAIHKEDNKIDILYMDFSEYMDDSPIYGSEYITRLLNPSEVFSSIERQSLKELFNSHQYRAARRMAKTMLNRLKKRAEEFPSYNLHKQVEELQRIFYFSKLYEQINDFNYNNVVLSNKYLTQQEIKMYEEIKDIRNNIKPISNNESKVQKLLVIDNNKEKLLFMAIDRIVSAKRYAKIDYQSYLIRLASIMELTVVSFTGICEGSLYLKLSDIFKKGYISKKLYDKLDDLRRTRNNLNIVHGFSILEAPKQDYEAAILEFIKIAFNKDEEELQPLIRILTFKTFEQIFIKEA